MSLELPFGYKQTVASSNVDSMYGPYESIAEALITVVPALRAIGRTVGVIEVDGVKEYWFKEGILDTDLIKKAEKGDTGDFGLIEFKINDNMELEYSTTAVLNFDFELNNNKELILRDE